MKRLFFIPLAALLTGCTTPPPQPTADLSATPLPTTPFPTTAVAAANPNRTPTEAEFIAGVGLPRAELDYCTRLIDIFQRNKEALKIINECVKSGGKNPHELQDSQRIAEGLRVEHVQLTASTPPHLANSHSMMGQSIALTSESARQFELGIAAKDKKMLYEADDKLQQALQLSMGAGNVVIKHLEDAKKRAGQ